VNSDQLKIAEAEVTAWIRNIHANGSNELWGRVFEKYKKNVYILCLKMLNNEEDAKDLTSDVFIRAFENIHTYELQRPFLPWLYGITKNLCIDHIRKKRRIHFSQIDNCETIKNDEDPSANENSSELEKKIKRAIDKLKRPQKVCFCLFYMHQKSYKDIVKLTGYSYDEVRSHIQNGRRNFKLILER
jgi:RNA polymerase sigma factor (sigma-70 family)